MNRNDAHIEPLDRRHLDAVMALCRAEGWDSYVEHPEITWRALTAPGVCTLVAVEGRDVVGFVQIQSDGVIQAHLSLIVVAPPRRRRGMGRRLIEEALGRAGAKRIDLLCTERADGFYRSFEHRTFPGYRIYPRPTARASSSCS